MLIISDPVPPPPHLAALIWQLMRAYTLTVLSQLASSENPIVDREIIEWVNEKLQAGGKTSRVKSFQVRARRDQGCRGEVMDGLAVSFFLFFVEWNVGTW